MPTRRGIREQTHVERGRGEELGDFCTISKMRGEGCEGAVLEVGLRIGEEDVERFVWCGVEG